MFADLLFLILALLTLNILPDPQNSPFPDGVTAFLVSCSIYLFVCFGIYLQGLWAARSPRYSPLALLFTNLLLLSFLLCHNLVIMGWQLFPLLPNQTASQTLLTASSLITYFFGLWLFHQAAQNNAAKKLRFLVPFALPFCLFSLGYDFAHLFLPSHLLNSTLLSLTATCLFLISLMLVMPAAIVSLWGCTPLPSHSLEKKLQTLCRSAHFRYRDMLLWETLPHTPTAAILGIIARFRYIIFSPTLLHNFSEAEIEAVLAHEIGHSRHRHLLLFPFILLGMVVVTALLVRLISPSLTTYFALEELLHPHNGWKSLIPLFLFIPYAVTITLYLRIVFGFFSRTFERQADLHPFALGVPPEALVSALDRIGHMTGGSHREPNWHHFSIQERIDFLEAANSDHRLIADHHKKTKQRLIGYFLLFAVGAGLLLYPYQTPLDQAALALRERVSQHPRHKLAQRLAKRYPLLHQQEEVTQAFEQNLLLFGATNISGVLEFYVAQSLYREGLFSASAQIMATAWKRFDFEAADRSIWLHFFQMTERLMSSTMDPQSKERLLEAFQEAELPK